MNLTAEKVANNVILLVVARVSMAVAIPLMGFMFWLAQAYIDGRFVQQDNKLLSQRNEFDAKLAVVSDKVSRFDTEMTRLVDAVMRLGNQLTVLETKQTQEFASSGAFQSQILIRMDKLQESQISMSNSLSGLAAIIQTQRDLNDLMAPKSRINLNSPRTRMHNVERKTGMLDGR